MRNTPTQQKNDLCDTRVALWPDLSVVGDLTQRSKKHVCTGGTRDDQPVLYIKHSHDHMNHEAHES